MSHTNNMDNEGETTLMDQNTESMMEVLIRLQFSCNVYPAQPQRGYNTLLSKLTVTAAAAVVLHGGMFVEKNERWLKFKYDTPRAPPIQDYQNQQQHQTPVEQLDQCVEFQETKSTNKAVALLGIDALGKTMKVQYAIGKLDAHTQEEQTYKLSKGSNSGGKKKGRWLFNNGQITQCIMGEMDKKISSNGHPLKSQRDVVRCIFKINPPMMMKR
eukprot:15365170-Ditylum_brightwellii.AAC.1